MTDLFRWWLVSSRSRMITYWISTCLVVFALGSGGIADIVRPASVVEGMTHLGYPSYFCVILGVWKVGGAVVLLAPRLPRLKVAYAGAIFDFTGAAASHLAVGDDATKLVAPVILTVLTLASWSLRPASRLLANQPA